MRLLKPKSVINESFKVNVLVKAFASGLGTGYIPFASGTFGSLLGAIIYYIPGFSDPFVLLLAILIGFVAGVFVSELMKYRYGKDPAEVVIDEIVGLWFTYFIGQFILENFFKAKMLDPVSIRPTKVAFAVIGFLLFRFFDIIKLQPAKYFDECDNGYGIMMDDVAAGIYAGVLTAVVTHLFWFKFLIRFF